MLKKWLLLAAMFLPFSAWAADDPDNMEQLKSALYEVLTHGDLSDIKHLSNAFDLGLRVEKPRPPRFEGDDPTQHSRAIATKNPDYTFASRLRSMRVFCMLCRNCVSYLSREANV